MALYVVSTPRALEYVLWDCRPRVLIVEQELLPRLADVSHHVRVASLETCVASRPVRFDFQDAWRSRRGRG